jgi:hypothetical protein
MRLPTTYDGQVMNAIKEDDIESTLKTESDIEMLTPA